jgi:hypothetical protein
MGPRASLDVCEKSRTQQDLIPRPSNMQPVAIPTLQIHQHSKRSVYLRSFLRLLYMVRFHSLDLRVMVNSWAL